MRAVIAKQRGSKGVIGDVPIPEVKPDEMLVRVVAAGVNPIDWKSVEGGDRDFPMTMGQDFAGVVVETGADVGEFQIDDRVFGIARNHGAFAEFTVIPQHDREQPVAVLPDDIDDVQGAALPTAGLTAMLAIETLKLRPGMTVMICGVSGGVGSIAAQIALARGMRVIGTASSKSEQFVRSLGDVEFVPYDLEEPVSAALFRSESGVDGVVDLVDDADHIRVMADAIKPGGAIASTIGALDEAWFAERKITATNIVLPDSPRSSPQSLLELAAMIERGELTVKIAEETDLEHTPEALEESKEGNVNGKIVIHIT